MPTPLRHPGRPGSLIVSLAILLTVCMVAGFQAAPAPAPADDAAPTKREGLAERQREVAEEIVAARARIDALPADAPGEQRTELTREVELLETLELMVGQVQSTLDTIDELTALKGELTEQLDDVKTNGLPEPPPYSLLRLDAARDQLESDQSRAKTMGLAIQNARDAVVEARRRFDNAEAERRLAKEAEEADPDDADRAALAAAHRLARLRSRVTKALLQLRETELQRDLLSTETFQLRIAVLEEQIGWMRGSIHFTREDLRAKLMEIATRRDRARSRLELLEGNASYAQERWFEAKRRLDGATEDDPALVEEVLARKLAYQAQKEEIEALETLIARTAAAETVWNRRHELRSGMPDRATMQEWSDEAVRIIDALMTEQRLQSAKADDLRSQLASIATRLEGVDPSETRLLRGLTTQQDNLRAIAGTLDGRLAGLDATRRLEERLVADIGLRTARVTWAERMSDLWESVTTIWRFELTSIDERSITVGKIVTGLLILFIGLLASRLLSGLLGRRILPRLRMNEGAVAAVQTLIFYILVITFVLFALRAVNIPLTAFTVLGGAIAIGIGFGSQNLVNNFISGLVLLAERPVRVGDLIQVGELYGTVEHIGARSTRVRTGSNVEIIVPNSSFLEQNVVNWTLSEDRIRASVAVGIAYGSPTRDVVKLMRRAVDEHGRVLKTPAPIVLFTEFGDNALQFEVHFWIKVKRLMDRRMVESDLRHRMDGLFRDAHITIAFPQRDVHLDTSGPIGVRLVEDGALVEEETVAAPR